MGVSQHAFVLRLDDMYHFNIISSISGHHSWFRVKEGSHMDWSQTPVIIENQLNLNNQSEIKASMENSAIRNFIHIFYTFCTTL